MFRGLFAPKKKPKIDLDQHRMPQHIAIIMDGNGRWALKRGLPRNIGHQQGVKAFKSICYACRDLGIKYLTVYAFSTENWERPATEVNFLMKLFRKVVTDELEEIIDQGARVRIIGHRSDLPEDILKEIDRIETRTKNNDQLNLNICFNYGGRAEIVDAVKKIIKTGVDPDSINELTINDFLYTQELPDVDLTIRTSGEKRLSNFLIYQSAYAEIIFSPVYWPDFSKQLLLEAIFEFQNRERRFGRI